MYSLFFFFLVTIAFKPMTFAHNGCSYHQTKTPIGFWCRRNLNPSHLLDDKRFYQHSRVSCPSKKENQKDAKVSLVEKRDLATLQINIYSIKVKRPIKFVCYLNFMSILINLENSCL